MRTWIAALALLALPVLAHETGEQHTHGFFVPTEDPDPGPDPGPEPPEPGPEPPPGGIEARERWEAQCFEPGTDTLLPGVLSCRTWDSVRHVYESSNMSGFEWTGVPNSPNRPLTNGKCYWNNTNPTRLQTCFPAWGAELDETGQAGAISSPDDYTCEARADREQNVGYSQESVEQASLRSPCYHPEVPGAIVMTKWADLGSSIQHAGLAQWDDRPTVSALFYEYEIAVTADLMSPQKGSHTSKMMRVEQEKGECPDNRLIDERFLSITAQGIDIGYAFYCRRGGGESYSPSEATLKLGPEDVLEWFRVSRHITEDGVHTRAVRVETGEVLVDHFQEVETTSPFTLRFARILIHATSHEACTDDCDQWESGHFAVRHVVFKEGR